jgi:small subunit ribosomal protein S3
MGQKVSPHGLRVGVIKDWDSKWFADKSKFADFLVEDIAEDDGEVIEDLLVPAPGHDRLEIEQVVMGRTDDENHERLLPSNGLSSRNLS